MLWGLYKRRRIDRGMLDMDFEYISIRIGEIKNILSVIFMAIAFEYLSFPYLFLSHSMNLGAPLL
jgi:hypothetical protein